MTDRSAPPQKSTDPLVIRHLEFLGPMATADGWRPASDLPEVAFAGRSNVGKSSLLNKLVRRKAFARVSNTPGRTREINFFAVNHACTFADLPGYGYARISKGRRAEWKPLIEGFLRSSRQLRGIVQLLDLRHDPSPEDEQMFDLLADIGVPTIVVATKVDKVKPAQVAERLHALAVTLGIEADQMIPFSAVTGAGRDELAAAIVDLLAQPAWKGAETGVESEEPSAEDA